MKLNTLVKPISVMLVTAVLSMGSVGVWAADTAPAKPAPPPPAKEAPPSKETREKMAQIHEKLAGCLRSDRPVAECHQEMKKACHDTGGEHACGMMGERHKMMMHDADGHDHDHAKPAGAPPTKP